VTAPEATGAALPRDNSGYVTCAEFWRNGTMITYTATSVW
jgi:hypothetical protein